MDTGVQTGLTNSPQQPAERRAIRLVLVGLGADGAAPPGGLPPLESVAAALAHQLVAVASAQVRALPGHLPPRTALAALLAPEPSDGSSWLAPLLVDVGLPLPEGGTWAEALGAWRQPTLLVIAGPQLSCGLAAAGTALLRQWRVPLLGLLQWGGAWDPGARRADGLPWLGWLPAEAHSTEAELAALGVIEALTLAWRRLEAG
ncbi:MAG: hypothetical protein ACKOXO_10800 [Cyanobium sp.]